MIQKSGVAALIGNVGKRPGSITTQTNAAIAFWVMALDLELDEEERRLATKELDRLLGVQPV